ncbi:GNAT family N-acetyltransferase [Prochlorothrix hollandica]|uniref:GNAT family N-acetyltransferase n=1 Tax=Prochlorothrix hollandica TaxID=1223 RepID=UPI000346CD71|nr:GNAT family N-acetyltransferase [Prochlorothrix hollandica]
MIREATPQDAIAICRIYNPYILQTTITFEESPVIPQDMEGRIRDIQERGLPWLVWEEGGEVLGYAYARPWQTRSAYRHTLESSIYIDRAAQGRGIGRSLYVELLQRLRDQGMHVVVGCIALPNPSSALLHQKLGFQKVGLFPEVGLKFNQWIDVEYWQIVLNTSARVEGGAQHPASQPHPTPHHQLTYTQPIHDPISGDRSAQSLATEQPSPVGI